MKTIFLFFTALMVLTGCSKKTTQQKDMELPVIILNSPVNGQTYIKGESINIGGSITDNTSIAEVHIHVTNLSTGLLYLDVHIILPIASLFFPTTISQLSVE